MTGSTEVMQILIDAGMNFSGVEGGTHETPLNEALTRGTFQQDWKAYEFLLDNGVDINIKSGPGQFSVGESAAALGQFDRLLELLKRGYTRDIQTLKRRVEGREIAPERAQDKQAVLDYLDEYFPQL